MCTFTHVRMYIVTSPDHRPFWPRKEGSGWGKTLPGSVLLECHGCVVPSQIFNVIGQVLL